MNIGFKNKKLCKTFSSSAGLHTAYGGKMAKTIMNRMAVLQAAPTLEDVTHLPPEKRHELKGNRKGQYAVYLKHPFRLVFIPDHDPVPKKPDAGDDLSQITAITILKVEDYH